MFVTLLPLLIQAPGVEAFSPEKHPVSPDGVRAVCDVPVSQHIRNKGGSDGAGLCVFTSMQLAADWQELPFMADFQRWMTRRPGGGYPEKVDRMLKKYCQEKGVPVPPYIQHTGGDESVLELALKTGRMPCITYGGRDDFYRSGIYHMVNLVHLDSKTACIVDNNRPGTFLFMTRAELLQRWRSMDGGWTFVFLASPPPPYNGPPTVQFEEPANFGVDAGQVHKEPKGQGKDANNFGIVSEKVHSGKKYTLTGVEVTEAEARAALTDDSNRLNVTSVGDDAVHSVLRKVVESLPEATRHRIHVQCYGPATWEATQFGLDAGLTVRSVAVNRIGKDLKKLDAYNATSETAVRTAILESLDPPAPMPPAPEPVPVPEPQPEPEPEPEGGSSLWTVLAALVAAVVAFVIGRQFRK